MNQKDKKILNILQENFPLEERPYLKIAQKLGMQEAEVVRRIRQLMDVGIIRRFGIIINHKKLDYYSTLIGLKLSVKHLPKIVAFVVRRPEVTHCYQREGEYNLWLTFLTPRRKIFKRFLSALKKKVGSNNIVNLPTIKSFKLRTTFKIK